MTANSLNIKEDNITSINKTRISFEEVPDWRDGHFSAGFKAFLTTLEHLKASPYPTHITKKLRAKAKDIQPENKEEIKTFIQSYFNPFLITDQGKHEGLFTGYYQPTAKASKVKSKGFCVPIYRRPPELIVIEDLGEFRLDLAGIRLAGHLKEDEFKPYFTRKEITSGALENRKLEIAWIQSDIDAFFMAVQGSGLLEFENGVKLAIGYDGANGYPYTAIGKVLKDLGHLAPANITMQSIRSWLTDNHTDCSRILNQNQSYIFFKELPHLHPEGALKVGLTPMGSLAVDPRHIPLGSLLWLKADTPQLNTLVVAQDVGSAIKGVIRGDYYWGTGKEAGEHAGKMATRGRYYLFEPK